MFLRKKKMNAPAQTVPEGNELEQITGCEHVAVFGHEGTVHQIFNHAVGYDVLLEHLQVDNASATVFSYEDGCWKLLKWNYTGAL